MTYCVGIKVRAGLVCCSDSRTSAGVDQVHSYRKTYNFGVPGQRQLTLMASGNLATTYGVVNQLQEDIDNRASENLLNTASLHQTAEYVGRTSRSQQAKTGGGPVFAGYFLLCGQIQGKPIDVLLIYPEGNYIAASDLEPFLQIGESKYGKPILDRIVTLDTDLQTAALCALVSMISTFRSNLAVGPPIDLQLYRADSFAPWTQYHLTEDSTYLRDIDSLWHNELLKAFRQLPPLEGAGK